MSLRWPLAASTVRAMSLPIRFGHHPRCGLHVGAVDRGAGHELAQRLVDLVAGEVPEAPVPLADADHELGQAVDVAAQKLVQHEVLFRARHRLEGLGPAREGRVELGKGGFARRVAEQPARQVEEIIARGARDRPVARQRLARVQDLLDHDPGLGRGRAQALEVLPRVEKPVRVVDPQPVRLARSHPAQDELVRAGEDAFVLGVQPDQAGDIEEAPVAEVAGRGAPVGQAIVLLLQERVQEVGGAVDLRDRVPQAGRRLRVLRQRAAQELEEHAFVAAALPEGVGVGGHGGQQALKDVRVEPRGFGPRPLGRAAQQPGDRVPRGREAMIEVHHPEGATVVDESDLAAFQHPAVVVAEHRQQDLVEQAFLGRVPLHVEVAREGARRAVLEHVPPPGVRGPGDAHVVGDDVEDLPDPARVQGGQQPPVAVRAPELGVDAAVVDHVVAVPAPRGGLQVGRGVEVTHPEVGQVVDHGRGVVEGEAGVKLQAVGGQRGVRHPGSPGAGPRSSGPCRSPCGRRAAAGRHPRTPRRPCPGCAASRSCAPWGA